MIERARNRVLVVEDDVLTLRPIATHLARSGFEVRTARQGEHALQISREFLPDLLLSEWVLGDELGGLEVARKLAKRLPDLRLVFLSSSPAEKILREGRDLRIRAALTKPASLQDILATVQEALDE